jgi:hypothetical protein
MSLFVCICQSLLYLTGSFHEKCLPSVFAVPECGKLFEWYMDVCAPYTQNRQWNKMVKDTLHGNGFPINEDEQQVIKAAAANGFVGWCLYHVSAIGTACRRQMFYHTFVATYFGLSREGIDMLSRYGFTQALRTFDDTRDDIRIVNSEKTRYSYYVCVIYSCCVFYVCVWVSGNLFRKFFRSVTQEKFTEKILVGVANYVHTSFYFICSTHCLHCDYFNDYTCR